MRQRTFKQPDKPFGGTLRQKEVKGLNNKSKWFFAFNGDCNFLELEQEVSENPTDEELNRIAQALFREYKHTDITDYVNIGKARLVTIEMLSGNLGGDVVEMLEDIALDLYDCEDGLFSSARNKDLEDLDKRLVQTLTEWAKERNVMDKYYTIPETREFYYNDGKRGNHDKTIKRITVKGV